MNISLRSQNVQETRLTDVNENESTSPDDAYLVAQLLKAKITFALTFGLHFHVWFVGDTFARP